jgi:hypothetical protein
MLLRVFRHPWAVDQIDHLLSPRKLYTVSLTRLFFAKEKRMVVPD